MDELKQKEMKKMFSSFMIMERKYGIYGVDGFFQPDKIYF